LLCWTISQVSIFVAQCHRHSMIGLQIKQRRKVQKKRSYTYIKLKKKKCLKLTVFWTISHIIHRRAGGVSLHPQIPTMKPLATLLEG